MSRYTDFKLYVEEWGGYPERDHAFGNPGLFWLIASGDKAARCQVSCIPRGAMGASWEASWTSVPYALVEPIPHLLEEIGAFGDLQPLVVPGGVGDYRLVWDVTGVVGVRPFHFSLDCIAPGAKLTELGERLRSAVSAIRNHSDVETAQARE